MAVWQKQYEKTFTGITRESIWSAWADVESWPKWDKELEFTQMSGPFKKGSKFILKAKGGPRVSIELTSVIPRSAFTDVTRFPLAKMCDVHEMEDTDEGLKLKSTIRVEGVLGWLWKRIVAQGVADGVPQQMEALTHFVSEDRRKAVVGQTQE
jgi:hypothetical protein